MNNEGTELARRHWVYRHPLTIRVTHWINVLCLAILLMSGLQIFNAHPALYFGTKSTFEAPSLEMKAVTPEALKSGDAAKSGQSLAAQDDAPKEDAKPSPPASKNKSSETKGGWTKGGESKASESKTGENSDDEAEQPDATANRGVVTLGGRVFDTTGWLGFTEGPDGELAERGFPSWITVPGAQDLATARRWHLTFAWALVLNGLVYLVFAFASGHVRRDLWARAREWRDIPHSIWQHIRLRFPKGEEARHYNVLQKLSYLVIIFIVLPVMILAGMAMSPGLNARFPFLLTLFGGRQTARTIHFILAFGLVGFAFIHVAMVILSGFFNNMRAMITGRYVITAQQREVP